MDLDNILYTYSDPRSVARAKRIAQTPKNIFSKQVRYKGSETIVNAFVSASSNWADHYRTSVTINESKGRITDYSCTCPAYLGYDGMCKHCGALYITFRTHPQSFQGYSNDNKLATSSNLMALMHRAEASSYASETIRSNSDAQFGELSLETTLDNMGGSWLAHFKIKGPRGSYVIKSISEFTGRMHTNAHFEYGQKLAFTHIDSMFDATSQEIIHFLERAVSLREKTSAAAYWRYRTNSAVGRELELSDAEMIELLDILRKETFQIKNDYFKKEVQATHVEEGNPKLALQIKKTEHSAYELKRKGTIETISQGSRLYIWDGAIFWRCEEDFAQCSDFLQTIYEESSQDIFIANKDIPLFCATILPLIEKNFDMQTPPELENLRPCECTLKFFFDKAADFIYVDVWANYEKHYFHLVGLEDLPAAEIQAAGGNVVIEEETGGRPGAKAGSSSAGVSGSSARSAGSARNAGSARSAVASTSSTSEEEFGPLRNTRLEKRAMSLVESYFELANKLAFIPMSHEEDLANLLFGGLQEFKLLGEVFSTPEFNALIRDKKPRINFGVSISGNLINLDVSAQDLPKDELSLLLSSYRKHKQFHRLKNGAFLNLAEFDLAQLDRISADLGLSARELASGHVELPAYRAFYLDEEENLDRDRSFSQYLDNFRAVDESSYTPPATLKNTLRPYQKEGFCWLSARCDAGFGGILADEMGLGKSIQLISFLLARKKEARKIGPSLVVCPSSLVYNWLEEFARFAPDLKVCAVAGPKEGRDAMRALAFGKSSAQTGAASKAEAAAQNGAAAKARMTAQNGAASKAAAAANTTAESSYKPSAKAPDVFVTSYDLMRIDTVEWSAYNFYCCALDEAHYIKNPATLTTRAAKRLRAHVRFALTGTPMENRLGELWSIFDFLMPGLLGPYQRFRKRFEEPIMGGCENTTKRLQAATAPFMLRRLKKDVLYDLPDKLESTIYVPLEGEQQKLYAACEQKLRESITINAKNKNSAQKAADGASKIEVLAELTKLRQLCLDPSLIYENYTGPAAKLDAILDVVESTIDAGEKLLIFSQFTSFLSRIEQGLRKHKIAYFSITGKTPKKQRVDLVNTFNADDTPVFLISLKAGGTGLNLVGASVVIHADPWWNEAVQNQATDRAHRIGQKRVVSVEKIIAKGTIEERIVRLQETKSELSRQIVGAAGLSLASLSSDDLAKLLSDE